jgi:hypothetical protein
MEKSTGRKRKERENKEVKRKEKGEEIKRGRGS